MKIVRIKDNVVTEIIPEYATPIEKWYNKSFAKECITAPNEVIQGWIYNQKTNTWHEPFSFELSTPTEIVSGTYTGTGLYGEDNPNSVRPNIQAKVLMIFQNDQTLLTLSRTEATNEPFTWSASSAKEQCNENGLIYNWIAIS